MNSVLENLFPACGLDADGFLGLDLVFPSKNYGKAKFDYRNELKKHVIPKNGTLINKKKVV